MWSSNPYPRELPKTQTTSLLAARFQRFSPRWSAFWAPHYLEPQPRRRQSGGIAPCKGATRRRHAVRELRMAQNPHRSRLKGAASPTRPGHSTGCREKTRPAPPIHQHFREKTRPASTKTPNSGCFGHAGRTLSRSHPPSDQAGRTISRTRHDNAATLKPTTPLLAPNKEPPKPASPLPPKNAPKNTRFSPAKATPVSVEARPAPAKVTAVSDKRAAQSTGPGRGTRGQWCGPAGSRDNAPVHTPARQAPPVWRAPEGPEGTGGLRGGARLQRPWAAAGPGRASRSTTPSL